MKEVKIRLRDNPSFEWTAQVDYERNEAMYWPPEGGNLIHTKITTMLRKWEIFGEDVQEEKGGINGREKM